MWIEFLLLIVYSPCLQIFETALAKELACGGFHLISKYKVCNSLYLPEVVPPAVNKMRATFLSPNNRIKTFYEESGQTCSL